MIGQTFPGDAFDGFLGARLVVHAKRHALVIAEIELAKVTLKVLRADVVIGADDAAFEDREISLNRIGVSVAANVLIGAVVDRFVAGELFSDVVVLAAFVRHQRRLAADLSNQDRAQRLAAHLWHMERADLSAALDQSECHFFASAADVALVALALCLFFSLPPM